MLENYFWIVAFNRTLLELKSRDRNSIFCMRKTFNRTLLELKYMAKRETD